MIRNIRTPEVGFTIIELIIVLTITIMLLASALALFNGRVPKAQFETGVNELSTRLTDAANQVSTGNYPTGDNFACETPSAGGIPVIDTSTPEAQGTNSDCLFLGQAIQFGDGNAGCPLGSPNENCNSLNFFTVVGSRLHNGGVASNIGESSPIISEDLLLRYPTAYGLFVDDVRIPGTAPSPGIGGIAYVQSFGSKVSGSGTPSGAPQVQLVPLSGTRVGMPIGGGSGFTDVVSSPGTNLTGAVNPETGVLVCVRSSGTDQYAIIRLGSNGVATSVERTIYPTTALGRAECV